MKKARPTTPEAARAAGIEMRLLGKGLFRSGYKVRGCDIVIKFPLRTSNKTELENVQHARQEIARLKRLRKVAELVPYLPEVFYYDPKSGVTAMRHYPMFRDFEEQADAMGRMIQKLIFRIARVRCTDIHTENVRRQNQDAILIDLGY